MDENNLSDSDIDSEIRYYMMEEAKKKEEEPGESTDVEKEHNDNAKRLKTETETGECTGQTSENVVNNEENSPSTSSSVQFETKSIPKTRNYRKSTTEDNEETSTNDCSTNGDNEEGDYDADTVRLSPFSDSVHSHSNEKSDSADPLVLLKEKPKHNWFIIPELFNRQLGFGRRKQDPSLFQQRCYGSLHSVQRLELMYKLEQHEGCVNSLNFHPNGEYLASGSDDLKVVVWDWKNGKSLFSFDSKHRSNVFQTKFMPLSGDMHIVTASRDGQVRLAQVSAQEGMRSNRALGSHRGPCHKLAVIPDQPQIVLSAGEDGMVLRHDLRKSKPDKLLNVKCADGIDCILYSISSNPLNGNEFCVAGSDSDVRSYDMRQCSPSTEPMKKYNPFSNQDISQHVTCAVYNHNGSEILASYSDEDVYLFDVNRPHGEFLHQYQGHRNGATIKGVNFFGPKSEYIVSGSDCGYIYFWDRNTEGIVQWLLGDDKGVVNCLEPHPQLPFISTSGLDWDIKVWVPSCEDSPKMTGLSDVVRENMRFRIQNKLLRDSNFDDTNVLWMLLRHINGRESTRFNDAMDDLMESDDDNSSDSTNDGNSNSSDDNNSGPPGCTTS